LPSCLRVDNSDKRFCKAKIPPKIKIFLLLIDQNVILTKDNLVKRKCEVLLFFDCSMARYIWSLILIALVVGTNCRPTSLSS